MTFILCEELKKESVVIFNYMLIRVELLLSFCGLALNRKGNVVELAWALRAEPSGQNPILLLKN